MRYLLITLLLFCVSASGCGTPAVAKKTAENLSINTIQLSNNINEFTSFNNELDEARIQNLKHLDEVTADTIAFLEVDNGILKITNPKKYEEMQWIIATSNISNEVKLIDQPVMSDSDNKSRAKKLKESAEILSCLTKDPSLGDELKFYYQFTQGTIEQYNKKKKEASKKSEATNKAAIAKMSSAITETGPLNVAK